MAYRRSDSRTRLSVLALVATGLTCGLAARAQKLPPGPQVLTFFSDIDDSEQPYALYLPKNFDPARKYPLVMMLHGGGSNHRLALRRVFGKSNASGESDAEATRYFPAWADVNYIVASPLARGTMAYQGIAEKDVLAVLADVKKRFPIDENRTYLTGLSLGGGGTLWIGLTHPDIWAATAPVCPDPAPGIFELAPNALNYPVHFFQGGADPTVNPEGTRQWEKRMKELGTKTEYTEYPGVGHNSWENAYKDEQIFTWFSQFTRNPHPDRVRYVSSDYDHTHAYWATLDRLTPGTFATLDAQFTGVNKIEVKTTELGAFTLELTSHPKFARGKALEVTIDGKPVAANASESLSFNKTDAGWVAGKFVSGGTGKRSGAQGPIVEALAGRLTYVYGTGGNPLASELEARRTQAADAANYAGNAVLLLNPPVVADRGLRPNDMKLSNLFLFGTKANNSVIAQLSDRLPMQLNDSATGYGLLYVYPIDGHEVVVSSGTQWWTPFPVNVPVFGPGGRGGGGRGAGAGVQRERPVFTTYTPFGGRPANALYGLGDWVLYRGSLQNIVAQGRFDEDWKIPAVDVEKLKAAGVVTIAAAK